MMKEKYRSKAGKEPNNNDRLENRWPALWGISGGIANDIIDSAANPLMGRELMACKGRHTAFGGAGSSIPAVDLMNFTWSFNSDKNSFITGT